MGFEKVMLNFIRIYSKHQVKNFEYRNIKNIIEPNSNFNTFDFVLSLSYK